MKKIYAIPLLLVALLLLLSGCVVDTEKNKLAVDPSYSTQQCFTQTGESMTFADAVAIANESECVKKGKLNSIYSCNSSTGTWWIELQPLEEKLGCSPACVVNVVDKTTEINWRCTGAVPE